MKLLLRVTRLVSASTWIRDARYGRNEECYAEDPYLVVGQMGSALCYRYAGKPEQTRIGIPAGKLMCTAKHFRPDIASRGPASTWHRHHWVNGNVVFHLPPSGKS